VSTILPQVPIRSTIDGGAVEVRFDDAHRPEEATHVRLESFDGPLGLLLSLIEQRQLDVLTVRLGDLAGAYFDALARLEGRRLPMLSAFVAVCSQLILIKSRALLPRAPVVDPAINGDEPAVDPEEELRRRLIEYRRYRDAGLLLGVRLERDLALFRREPGRALATGLAGARAPDGPPLDTRLLADALSAATAIVPPAPPPAETIKQVVTLEERARLIRQALEGAPRLVLQELLRDVRDRVVVAVTFLAMLELVKGGELSVEQKQPWGPIQIRRLRQPPAPAAPLAIAIEADD
jgi:segregation and condensation protein A